MRSFGKVQIKNLHAVLIITRLTDQKVFRQVDSYVEYAVSFILMFQCYAGQVYPRQTKVRQMLHVFTELLASLIVLILFQTQCFYGYC